MRLVRYAAEHVSRTQAWLDDPAVLAFTPVPEPVPADHAAGWLTRFQGAWAVVEADEVLGFACAPHVDLPRGEVELGYLVAPTARGRGVATFALSEMTAWAFEQGERCGYQLEGTLRSAYLKVGRRVDTTVWSRLVSDPEELESPD